MKVTIQRVSNQPGAPCRVHFMCDVGQAEGEWRPGIPVPGNSYVVELEIPHRLKWGRDIGPVEPEPPRIANGPNGIVVSGSLEHSDADGWTALRVGTNLVVVEVDGTAPPPYTWVKLLAPSLVLFPHNEGGAGSA